jgi:hypothetical protein
MQRVGTPEKQEYLKQTRLNKGFSNTISITKTK